MTPARRIVIVMHGIGDGIARARGWRAIRPSLWGDPFSLGGRRAPVGLDVRRAAPAKKRATSLVPRVGDDEIRDVVNDAAAVPPDVSPEDFNAFYRLLDSADAEQVEAKVKALVEGGGLTEGVLKAAFATLEQAQSRNDKPEIVASLQVR